VAEIVADWCDQLSDLDWLRHLNHLTLPRYNSGWQPPHQVLLVEKGHRSKRRESGVVGLAQLESALLAVSAQVTLRMPAQELIDL